jgi:hypothetical protein
MRQKENSKVAKTLKLCTDDENYDKSYAFIELA